MAVLARTKLGNGDLALGSAASLIGCVHDSSGRGRREGVRANKLE
jgi:hypothetical protein